MQFKCDTLSKLVGIYLLSNGNKIILEVPVFTRQKQPKINHHIVAQ